MVEGKRIKNDKKGGRGRMPVAVIAGNTIAAKPVPALSTQNLFPLHKGYFLVVGSFEQILDPTFFQQE